MRDQADSGTDQAPIDYPRLAGASRSLVCRLLAIAENRLDLLMVEAEEERRLLFTALLLVCAMVATALVADLIFSTLLVVWLWAVAPIGTLSCLCLLHGGAAALFYRRLVVLQRDRAAFSATVDQLRKDRVCFEKIMS